MEVKTTKQVENNFQFCYDDEVLNATDKNFVFDIYEKDMDGIFPNKASWTKFINRIDRGELADKLSYKRKNEYIKKIDYDTIEVFSNYGFNIATGFILDENNEKIYIYDNYKKITLKIDYDFYYRRDDSQIYGVEIYAQIEKLEK